MYIILMFPKNSSFWNNKKNQNLYYPVWARRIQISSLKKNKIHGTITYNYGLNRVSEIN